LAKHKENVQILT